MVLIFASGWVSGVERILASLSVVVGRSCPRKIDISTAEAVHADDNCFDQPVEMWFWWGLKSQDIPSPCGLHPLIAILHLQDFIREKSVERRFHASFHFLLHRGIPKERWSVDLMIALTLLSTYPWDVYLYAYTHITIYIHMYIYICIRCRLCFAFMFIVHAHCLPLLAMINYLPAPYHQSWRESERAQHFSKVTHLDSLEFTRLALPEPLFNASPRLYKGPEKFFLGHKTLAVPLCTVGIVRSGEVRVI